IPADQGDDSGRRLLPGQVNLTGQPDEAKATVRTIQTGKVQFTMTPDGRWVEFTPEWADGRSLFSSGGFVVYSADAEGHVSEIAGAGAAASGEERARQIRKCSEGTKGGFRAPSPNPDDDRDGRVDEDRLDGVDNDGDGRVDEDFAAIGDQMIAACYHAPAGSESGGDADLVFQQEAYAWALPHIDGTVMISLRVRNAGAQTFESVRIGAFLHKAEPFRFFERDVAPPKTASAAAAGRAFICEEDAATTVGLVTFPADGYRSPWMGGCLSDGDGWSETLLAIVNSDSRRAARPEANEISGVDMDGRRVEDPSIVYAVSPVLGSIAPGEELRVDLALVAVDGTPPMTTAAAVAYETFIGDGVNRYLPPPVSMTPRVLWGTYRPADSEIPGTNGIIVDVEALGDDPVSPDEISYFSGLGPGSVLHRETQPGVRRLVVRGEKVEALAQKSERIGLKGRLEDGEFFEIILRPEQSAGMASAAAGHGSVEAELYWKTAGRLDQDLLISSPNPFRDVTTISYEVPSVIQKEDGSLTRSSEPLETSVKVYNVVGRLVSVLVEEILGPGVHTTEWRAVDDQGNPVASGVYYVKLQLGKKYITKRLILLK
ncbi:MAG: T9SS type A sorting domain-containing protein, partial [bacterium]